ncbi:MMPL family transporter [Azohydromonas australica]|uniref:MMPL family transporter n=1 Tax=Azohydromonas australica TaxID=364039 RepID=UPI00048A6428|nr:MMPL family transporter [Azohydromonas australica]
MSPAAAPPPRGRTALLLWLALMALCVLLIARARFTADLSAFLPVSPSAQQRVLIDQLRSGVASRTLLVGITSGGAAERAQGSRALAAALRADARFDQVHNGERGDWTAAGELLLRHRYQLSPAVDAERFSVAGLRDAIDETLSLLGTPAGAAVKPVLERDPTGELQRIAEGLIPSQAPRMEDGVWVSRTEPRALLLLTLHAPGDDLDAQAAAIDAVRAAFAPQAARGLALQLSGAPLFAVDSRSRIQHEVIVIAVTGLVVIGGLLLAAFASLRALAVAMLPVASGVVAGIAAVALGFGTVHGITLGFGSTLIGEAVDYALYYLIQARDGGWRRWRDHAWPTVRLGLLTSVCGFAALVFSGFPGLAQLGVFSVAGLAAAALTTRWVLPVLVPAGAAGSGRLLPLGRWTQRAARALGRARGLAWLLGAGAALLLALQHDSLWRGDLASLSPVPVAAQRLDASLRADLGASDARTLVVATGADLQAALRGAEAAAARLDALAGQGVIGGYETPTRVLPSLATQQQRQAALPDADALRQRLAQAVRGTPLAQRPLEPFLAEVQGARTLAPLTLDALAGTPLKAVADALLIRREDGGWTALLPLQPPGAQADAGIDAPRVRAALQGLPGEVAVLDIKQELDGLYARYLHEALVQALVGVAAVVALLWWQLRYWRQLWAACVPLALAVLITLGGFAALGIPLGILHLVGLLLVVAVGSNYGLFFVQWPMARADAPADVRQADTLASLLLANVTAVCGFGLIALSQIPALSAIGRVVAPGVLLALLLCAAFAPRR